MHTSIALSTLMCCLGSHSALAYHFTMLMLTLTLTLLL